MKRIKFEDLLRETIAKYNSFHLHLSKCNSAFSTQLFLDSFQLTSKSCDFGTWYFSQKDQINLPSLKEIELPYIKIYELYKLLEIQFHSKLSKKNKIKKKLPFVKSEPNPIIQTIDDLQIQCLLFIHNLKKIELEYANSKLNKKSIDQSNNSTKTKSKSELSSAEIDNTVVAIKKKTIQRGLDIPIQNTILLNKMEIAPSYETNQQINIKERISPKVNNESTINQSETYKFDEVVNESNSKNSEWESLMAMKKMMNSI